MTTIDPLRAERLADQFGRAVAMRLSAGTDDIPYEASERLRAARVRALAMRRTEAVAPVVIGRGGAATLGKRSIFNLVASVLPLLVLAAGLVLIHTSQSDRRASELAAVDTALLTDDLPPAAYADPGFVQYLKSGRE
jgi:hypothetical protein